MSACRRSIRRCRRLLQVVAGYGTALIGKWHLGMLPKFGPAQSGYDHFWGIRTGAIDYYSHKNPRGEDDLWDGEATIQQTGYLTDLLGDRAVEAIEGYAKAAGKPFLLKSRTSTRRTGRGRRRAIRRFPTG